jgi:DNA-binding IclR family transcriptional regulator
MASPRRKRYTVPALDKGLDIVELLSTAREPMTMREIGAKVRRSVSQIFRTLKVLEARNYIARPGNGDRYAPTNHLFELGMRRPPVVDLIGTAYPAMVETAAALNQSVHLAVPSHDQMVVIARVENPRGAGFAVKVGYRRYLSDAASGRVLLAFQPDAVRDELIGRVRKALARRLDEKALRSHLERIRARGFEMANSIYVLGVTDIGFPLFNGPGGAVACLSLPFVSRRDERVTVQDAVEAMALAARRISAALDATAGAR